MEGAYSLVFQLLSQTFLLMKVVKATKKYLNPATKVVAILHNIIIIIYKLQVCGSPTFQLLCNDKSDGTDQLVLQLLESLLGYSLGFNHWVQSI